MNSNEVELSFIVISYNEVKYIREAMESIFQQEISCEYEIIIGDDGSNDGSMGVIDEYIQMHPRIIKSFVMERKNDSEVIASVRVSNLLKKGFEKATGRYIIVLSADDIILHEYDINYAIAYLNNNPQYIACCCDYKKFWPDLTQEVMIMRCSLNRYIFWGSHYMHISCFVFRNMCLSNVLDRFCDDTGLLYSILKTGNVKHFSKVGLGYRQRDKSIMHSQDKMELCVLEMAVIQDCLNSGWCKMGTLAKDFDSIFYVYRKRNLLKEERYQKYIKNCNMYGNNILGIMNEYDDLALIKKIRVRINLMVWALFKYIFVMFRKLNSLISFLLKERG